jgi:hypothetical protein
MRWEDVSFSLSDDSDDERSPSASMYLAAARRALSASPVEVCPLGTAQAHDASVGTTQAAGAGKAPRRRRRCCCSQWEPVAKHVENQATDERVPMHQRLGQRWPGHLCVVEHDHSSRTLVAKPGSQLMALTCQSIKG